MLMYVFNHHYRAIDHRANRNGNPAQGHNIGIHPLVIHNNKSNQNTDRQTDNDHQRGTKVE